MMGNPLFESYRRELRQELVRRWVVRLVPVLGVCSVLALGWIYHVSTNEEPSPRLWGPPAAAPATTMALPLPQSLAAPGAAASTATAPNGDLLLGLAEPQHGVPAVLQQAPPAPTHLTGELAPGERLLDLLLSQGFARDEVDAMLRQLRSVFDPRRLRPGQKYECWRSLDGHLDRFVLQATPLDTYEVVLEGGRFVARQRQATTRTEVVRVLGTVESTVSAALVKAGERPGLAVLLRDFFASDIDFSLHARKGDLIKIIVEKVMVEDRFVRYGSILAAEYRGSVARLRGFTFTDADGRTGVYDEQGQSRQTMFLRSPVPGRRISSRFNTNRFHPILKRHMPHRGVDYQAPTGTPVLATADGQVVSVGRKGNNGLLVTLSHEGGYRTHYAHLSRVARGLTPGQQVKRGQVVAYTGHSGLSTAPHLHYAVSRDHSYLDPQKLPARRAASIPASSMGDFLATIAPLSRDLDHMALGNDALYGDLLITPP